MDLLDQTMKQVRKTLSKLSIPINVNHIDNQDSLQVMHGIDSIMLMEFMLLLEEEFGMEFDGDFDMNTLDTIKNVADYITKKR